MKTYFLQVKDVVQETSDAITIEFWHPLAEQIKYKAGQFLTLIVPADEGKKVRRSYSMSSSPHADTAVAVTVKRVEGGLVSNYLCDNIKTGDFIEAFVLSITFVSINALDKSDCFEAIPAVYHELALLYFA